MSYQITLEIDEDSPPGRNIERLAQAEQVSREEAALKLLAGPPRNGGSKASPEALETLAIEAYRNRLLSRGRLGELLGLSFQEREELLAARGIPYNYELEDLEADAETLDRVLGPVRP